MLEGTCPVYMPQEFVYRPNRIKTPAAIATTANTTLMLAKVMLTNVNAPVAMSQMPSKSMPQFLFVEFHFIRSLLIVVMAESAVSDA